MSLHQVTTDFSRFLQSFYVIPAYKVPAQWHPSSLLLFSSTTSSLDPTTISTHLSGIPCLKHLCKDLHQKCLIKEPHIDTLKFSSLLNQTTFWRAWNVTILTTGQRKEKRAHVISAVSIPDRFPFSNGVEVKVTLAILNEAFRQGGWSQSHLWCPAAINLLPKNRGIL